MTLKKSFCLLSLFSFLVMGTASCAGGGKTIKISSQSLSYGGDTNSITYAQFIDLYRANYQKSVRYTNTQIKVTSDSPFYSPNDPTEVFKGLDELHYIGAVVNEDNKLATQPFYSYPVNFPFFDVTRLFSYQTASAMSNLFSMVGTAINGADDTAKYYTYRATINECDIRFSSDYYITSISCRLNECNYNLDFSYFNENDMKLVSGKTTKEAFFSYVFVKASQKLEYDRCHVSLDYKNLSLDTGTQEEVVDGVTVPVQVNLYFSGHYEEFVQCDRENKTGISMYATSIHPCFAYQDTKYESSLTETQRFNLDNRAHFMSYFDLDTLPFLYQISTATPFFYPGIKESYSLSSLTATVKDKEAQGTIKFNKSGLVSKLKFESYNFEGQKETLNYSLEYSHS